ncbi:MAG: Fic family protein [Micrococcales bacterium]|nr:Fic family protein [Micrococcales bacterium]
MDLNLFGVRSPGVLVPVFGTDPVRGEWRHCAFVPDPLSDRSPDLEPRTYLAVANARAALAALDSTARRLPNPRLLRQPSLRTEAQSTSALEGTYAPLAKVLTADEERPENADLREVLNYAVMANQAFAWIEAGHGLTVGLLGDLQRTLVLGTRSEALATGVRQGQVVVGRRSEASPDEPAVHAARFVPSPGGLDLTARLRDLLDWMSTPRRDLVDPVVAAALAHYQFETLHPFSDGNGRIGRLLVVVYLLKLDVLGEPTLTVSPWFEARRDEYYDRLFAVSTDGDWDSFVRFFAAGLEASAVSTRTQMLALVDVQAQLHEQVRSSALRADTAHALVDYAVGHTSFTVKAVERTLEVSYARANNLVEQLIALGILAPLGSGRHRRRFTAPAVLQVLAGDLS